MRRLRKGQTAPTEFEPITEDADLPADAPPAAEAPVAVPSELNHPVEIAEPIEVFEQDQAPAAEPVPAPALSAGDLLASGELGLARAAMGSDDPALQALIEALAEGETVLRNLGLADPDDAPGPLRGIMLAPNPGARELLVVFGQDDGRYAVPGSLALGRRANLLFIQDPDQSLALLGVKRLGKTYDACLMVMTRLTATLGVRDIFCLGGGAACYSALRYGLDLGAAGVLAMGTLTRVERGVVSPGVRPARQAGRLFRLTAELGDDLELVFPRTSPRPGLVLCRPDPGAMSGLAALQGTKVTEAPPDAADDPLGWADRRGQLRGMVRELLRCRPVR